MTSRRDLYLALRSRAGRVRRGMAARRHRGSVLSSPVGQAPEVDWPETHLGPDLDHAVRRATGNMRVGVDADYDLVQENFDVLHYLLQAPNLLDRPRVDPVLHFLETGVEMRRSPDPRFSMESYLARYPERATGRERSPYLEWLKHGREHGEIADPAPRITEMAHVLGLQPGEVADLAAARRTDLQQRFRTGKLGEVFAKAARIEPLIGETVTEIAKPTMLPLSTPGVTGQVSAIYRAQEAAGFRRARLLLVINRPRWGGGRRIEGHVSHALMSHLDPEDIVVIYTDDTNEFPVGRYPEGVREVDFASIAKDLPVDQAQAALVSLIRSFHADAVVNINSRMLYLALRTLGTALHASERIFLTFFCSEKTSLGTWQGWSMRYFYRSFDHVAGVITDSQDLADELARTHRLPEEQRRRLHVFRAPVDPSLPVAATSPARPDRRPQVFWAGRWDRQKRIGLFLQVARQMPDVDFRMWGAAVMGSGPAQLPPNVHPQGVYGHLSEVPLDEADVWLYTSGWDGVPSQLLEVAMTGVPIVGTLVGGTGEVLSEEDAWPVPEDAVVDDYVATLRAALADPEDSRRRALALRERMLAERTEKAFAAQAVAVLLGDHEGEEARG